MKPDPGAWETLLNIDPAAECTRVSDWLRHEVVEELRRRGAVVGLSGGVDSSVVAALCARALGADRVFGLLMPDQESSPESLDLGRRVAESFGIATKIVDISGMLDAVGCYRRRDEAVRRLFPEYGAGWKCKIVRGGPRGGGGVPFFVVVVRDPEGREARKRPTAEVYREIIAAMAFKQRTRKMLEYAEADRLLYAVASTPNRLEYDQGFFVKNGDGAGDIKPIAHLYKTQVYELARHLGIPEEIRLRAPTADTYPLELSQDEFFFRLPYRQMDLCLLGRNLGVSAAEIARAAGLELSEAEHACKAIDERRRSAIYLHAPALTVEPVVPGTSG
jgi:NAD+ synthase